MLFSNNSGVIVLVTSNRPRFWNYSPDYSLNCTPLSPITITNSAKINSVTPIFLNFIQFYMKMGAIIESLKKFSGADFM